MRCVYVWCAHSVCIMCVYGICVSVCVYGWRVCVYLCKCIVCVWYVCIAYVCVWCESVYVCGWVWR